MTGYVRHRTDYARGSAQHGPSAEVVDGSPHDLENISDPGTGRARRLRSAADHRSGHGAALVAAGAPRGRARPAVGRSRARPSCRASRAAAQETSIFERHLALEEAIVGTPAGGGQQGGPAAGRPGDLPGDVRCDPRRAGPHQPGDLHHRGRRGGPEVRRRAGREAGAGRAGEPHLRQRRRDRHAAGVLQASHRRRRSRAGVQSRQSADGQAKAGR